ncbi:Uncharacterized protein Fot_56537 [Forsythia ovata]|uniref:Uncharacterized protein n=1 Tax=Forsythia ovata TaxID=205694 RepID=A0ABD1NZS7_9LAMI
MKGMLKFLEKLTSEKHEVRNVQQSIWAKVKAERAPRWPGIEEYASWPRLGQRLEPGTRAHQRLAMDPIFQTKRTRKTLTTFLVTSPCYCGETLNNQVRQAFEEPAFDPLGIQNEPKPIPDGSDVNLDWTLAPPMVDDRPAPPLVGSQQAPVVADVFPERGELDSIVQRASIPHPRGEFSAEQQDALKDRAIAHLSHKEIKSCNPFTPRIHGKSRGLSESGSLSQRGMVKSTSRN